MPSNSVDYIVRYLPVLRATAMMHTQNIEQADEMVELALRNALGDLDGLTPDRYVEEWLLAHLEAVIPHFSMSPDNAQSSDDVRH